MKRRITIRAATVLLILTLLACAAKQTPQYNAAVVSNDFAHALGTLQTEVISLHQQKLLSDSGFTMFKSAATQANKAGLSADKLIASGDWNGALPLLTSAMEVLQGVSAATLGINDPNGQLIYSSSLNAAIATLEITIAQTQQKAAKKGVTN